MEKKVDVKHLPNQMRETRTKQKLKLERICSKKSSKNKIHKK